jgi:enediyne biosynthesis protein E4
VAAVLLLLVVLGIGFANTMPAPHFEDITKASKIDFKNVASHTSRKYLPETMVGGVAMFDYNNDGKLDLFFVNGAALKEPMSSGDQPDKHDSQYWNRLFRNDGNNSWTDVTAEAGLQGDSFGMGVAAGDFDNDGFVDLYVTGVGHNALYHNNGNGSFSDITKMSGTGGSGWSTGAMFVDYDRDGLLDLFVSRYLTWSFAQDIFCGQAKPGYRAYCHPDQFPPVTHLLFHNEGKGRFRDVSEESRIAASPGKGLGVAFNDYDRDGWPDLFVANDSTSQQLFHNLKNGTFEEVATTTGIAYDEDGNVFAGMGTDFADIDNNGWPSIFVNALAKQKYALFRNSSGRFDYASGRVGLAAATVSHSGWGAKLIDIDNDGWKDLFVAQGHVMDNIQLTQPDVRYQESPLFLRNVPPLFVDGWKAGDPLSSRVFAARGAAFGYLHDGGSVDVAVNNNDGPAVLLEWQNNANHWLIVEPVGTRSNRDAIGTQIEITTGTGKHQYGLATAAGSYLSANDKRVHFGLGKETVVKSIELRWPSGAEQQVQNPSIDRVIRVQELPR